MMSHVVCLFLFHLCKFIYRQLNQNANRAARAPEQQFTHTSVRTSNEYTKIRQKTLFLYKQKNISLVPLKPYHNFWYCYHAICVFYLECLQYPTVWYVISLLFHYTICIPSIYHSALKYSNTIKTFTGDISIYFILFVIDIWLTTAMICMICH